MKNKKKKQMILKVSRILTQILFFLFFPYLFSQAYAGAKEIFLALGAGKVIDFSSIFVSRLVILCGLTFFAGRIFCGWACSFGAIGDWIYQLAQWIQKKTKKKWVQIPAKAIPHLQKLKYLVLLATLSLCFFKRSDLVTSYSPWTFYSMLIQGKADFATYLYSAILLLVILVGMALKERFFCQFLCPLGAIFSFIPNLPIISLRRNKSQCIKGCKACQMQCPVQVKLGEDSLRDGECISCGKCTLTCPRSNIKPSFLSLKSKKEDQVKA
ncbi:MAG: 4Fe-4S binding protein [Eubacterium sp.]|nr:4Fe-4S binding protein [Eubacterium sp.]